MAVSDSISVLATDRAGRVPRTDVSDLRRKRVTTCWRRRSELAPTSLDEPHGPHTPSNTGGPAYSRPSYAAPTGINAIDFQPLADNGT